jgi:hypothetical protein
MLLELTEVEHKDLVESKDYFVTIETHPPLSRAFYVIDDNEGGAWMVDHFEFSCYPLTPQDKVYEIPQSLIWENIV